MSENENNETIADIVAEMRIFKCRNLETGELNLCNAIANYFADRLEAAWKREAKAIATENAVLPAVCITNKPTGNAAAMREALEYLLEERDILDFCHNNLGSKTWEDWDKVYRVLRKVIEKAMRAIAAPPRNCDAPYADEHKLWMRWQNYCAEIYPKTIKFSTLLLATATERGEQDKGVEYEQDS